ncbi:MAG: hypothetical protein HEEMFOPI_00779 [Holosporales bacterium]
MKKILFIFIGFESFVFSTEQLRLPTDQLINVAAFNENDTRLPAFNAMCEDIGKIVNGCTKYFISYAWPSSTSALRSWIDHFRDSLVLALGKKEPRNVIYDTVDFTGRVPDLCDRLKERDVIVLLTPDYHFKCEMGEQASLSKEGQLVFRKNDCERKFILLAGRDVDSFPTRFGGHYTLGAEMLHMMTGAPYSQQRKDDVPKMDAFFSVMCNLLDPTKEWGLLYHLSAVKKEQCLSILNMFKIACGFVQTCQTLSHPEKTGMIPQKKVTNIDCDQSEKRLNSYYFQERINEDGVNYIEKIKEYFEKPQDEGCRFNIVNLSGTGGIGKTTLARKFAVKNMGCYDVVWLFPYEKKESFEDSIKALYKSLYANDALLSDLKDIISAVKEKLKHQNLKCLFLYDNVRDEIDTDSLFMGDILITSRKTIEKDLVQSFSLTLFNQEESIHCLKMCSNRNFDKEPSKTLEDIVTFLGYLPLAIAQAGYYLKNEKRETAISYLKKLKEKPLRPLKWEISGFPFSVYKTFVISYNTLSEESKTILFVLGFLNPENIPVDLLNCLDSKNTSDLESPSALDKLEQYGFLKYTGESPFLYGAIHRLYQAVIRFTAKDATSTDDMFGGYEFKDVYLKVVTLWQEWIKNYQDLYDKQSTYYYLTYFLQNWKTLNQYAVDYSIPTVDYQVLQTLKMNLLKDFLKITMNDELIFDELEVEKEDRFLIRGKLQDFLAFLKEKNSSIDSVSLHKWTMDNPTLSAPHFTFLKGLMENIDKFDFQELDLKRFLEWISCVEEENFDLLYGQLLETMDGHFDYPGFALGVTRLIPEENRKYFYQHFLSFTKEDRSIEEDDYELLVDCSGDDRMFAYVKYYLKKFDYNQSLDGLHYREFRGDYFNDREEEEIEKKIQIYKIVSNIFDEEFDQKYKEYNKMCLLFDYLESIIEKVDEEDREKKARLFVQRCMQYLNFMEQNGYCMKDEDNDFGSEINIFVKQSDEEWYRALGMLQNLFQEGKVFVVWSVDNLLDALLSVNWEKKLLICQFIQDVGISYFNSFNQIRELFEKNDEETLKIALGRLNKLINKRKGWGDYERLLINLLTIKTEEDFLFLERELAPLFLDSLFDYTAPDIENIRTLSKKNPEKWIWIKHFLSSHSLEDEFFSLFEVLCDVKDQKKLEKHFPFLKSVCDNTCILIQQIDELDDVDYESICKKISQKQEEGRKKIQDLNPKLIMCMGDVTKEQIEIISYFSDKNIAYNMIETVEALKTFDMTKMPFFKMLIDTLTSFKMASFDRRIWINLPYLLSLTIEEWGEISAKLVAQSKESTLSDVLLQVGLYVGIMSQIVYAE